MFLVRLGYFIYLFIFLQVLRVLQFEEGDSSITNSLIVRGRERVLLQFEEGDVSIKSSITFWGAGLVAALC